MYDFLYKIWMIGELLFEPIKPMTADDFKKLVD